MGGITVTLVKKYIGLKVLESGYKSIYHNAKYVTCTIAALCFVDLTEFGWKRFEGILQPIWDTDANMQAVNNKVKHLISGCNCRKGCTGRCGCCRAGQDVVQDVTASTALIKRNKKQ